MIAYHYIYIDGGNVCHQSGRKLKWGARLATAIREIDQGVKLLVDNRSLPLGKEAACVWRKRDSAVFIPVVTSDARCPAW